jgi:methylated-DNA-[protein]-cysteine S-methyltransferase
MKRLRASGPGDDEHDRKVVFDACLRTPVATLGLVVGADGAHVTGLHFLPSSHAPKAPKPDTLAHFVCAQLRAYLDNPMTRFDVPLRLAGTAHQLAVWRCIQEIPCGQTRTYGELAAAIGSSPRAVGAACGQNPVPIIVPCHRVTAADGSLGGFMGGKLANPLAIKQWLLRHEGALLI